MNRKGFSALPLSRDLITVTTELGFTAPTPIQMESIPLLLKGKDLIAQSKTGSGKTAAFGLPILEKIEIRHRDVQAFILCPTRELCAQVAREIRKLGRRHAGLQVLVVAGGTPIGPQCFALEKGVHIVVGTPGRVLDHLDRKTLDLRRVKTLVLDEADRMLEMGFEEDVERILAGTPKNRQTVLFSATFPPTIERMSRAYQNSPARIEIKDEEPSEAMDGSASAPKKNKQLVLEVEQNDRVKALLRVIEKYKPESVIVFCNFKASVANVAQELYDAGMSVDALHGDLEQRDRDRILALFRNGSVRILVATDVAARGLDVENLGAVINYELPNQPEIFVHRVGRTGRAGKVGFSVSFYSAREKVKVQAIEEYTSTTLEKEKTPDLSESFSEIIEKISIREPLMQTFYISAGRKDKLRPGDIVGALTGEAGGLPFTQVGKIEIHDRFSYVAVATEIAEKALTALQNGKIKGRKFKVDRVK